jgi:hypothetical protein
MTRQRNENRPLAPSLLTAETHEGFERAVRRALSGLKGSAVPLRRVIGTAMSELSARQVNISAALEHLNAIVENAGRGGAGDRMSLMTGQPRWMAVRDQVLDEARATAFPTPSA